MLLQGKKTGPPDDLAVAQKEEAYLPSSVKSQEEADPLSLTIVDLNRVDHPLEPGLRLEEWGVDLQKGKEESQKGGVFLLPGNLKDVTSHHKNTLWDELSSSLVFISLFYSENRY